MVWIALVFVQLHARRMSFNAEARFPLMAVKRLIPVSKGEPIPRGIPVVGLALLNVLRMKFIALDRSSLMGVQWLMFVMPRPKMSMVKTARSIQHLITAQSVVRRRKLYASATPTLLGVKEPMNVLQKQKMLKESFAQLPRFVTYLVKLMKFLALVEWMLMDAKSPMNATPLEEMSKETYVRPIVQGNVMRTKRCFVQVKQRKMAAKNLTYALLEERNRVDLRSEKNATVTAQSNVQQMKSNVHLKWILVIAVQLRRFADQPQRIFMV